jgi:hypothetical protein
MLCCGGVERTTVVLVKRNLRLVNMKVTGLRNLFAMELEATHRVVTTFLLLLWLHKKEKNGKGECCELSIGISIDEVK